MRLFSTLDTDFFQQVSDANMDESLQVLVSTITDQGGGVETEVWGADPSFASMIPCRVTQRDLTPDSLEVMLQRRLRTVVNIIVTPGVIIPGDRRVRLSIAIQGSTYTYDMRILDSQPDPSQVGQLIIAEGPV